MSQPTSSPPPQQTPLPRRAGRRGFEAFAERDFAFYWWSIVLATVGVEMLLATVAWQVYGLTGREIDLGLIGLVQFIPFAALFLITGLAADRLPRMRILAACLAAEGACAAGLLALTMSGAISLAAILAILVAFGVARAFNMPVQLSVVPLLLPGETFSNGIAWTGTGNKLARIVGPAAGGLLIAVGEARGIGEALSYGVATGLLTVGLALVFFVHARRQVFSREPVSPRSLLAGIHFILTRKVILGVISLDLFAVLVGGGAIILLPVFAKDILQVGAEGFGLLRSAVMGGAMAAGLSLARWPVTHRGGPLLLGATVLFGVCGFVFGASESFWLSMAVLAVMGAANTLGVVIRHAVVQLITPDDMRGRVSAAVGVFLGASNDLGALEAGVTAHWWGSVPAVLVGGAATVGIAAAFAWAFPVLRGVDRLDAGTLVHRYGGPHDRRGRATGFPPPRA